MLNFYFSVVLLRTKTIVLLEMKLKEKALPKMMEVSSMAKAESAHAEQKRNDKMFDL